MSPVDEARERLWQAFDDSYGVSEQCPRVKAAIDAFELAVRRDAAPAKCMQCLRIKRTVPGCYCDGYPTPEDTEFLTNEICAPCINRGRRAGGE